MLLIHYVHVHCFCKYYMANRMTPYYRVEKQRQVLQEKVAQQHAAAAKAKQAQEAQEQKQRTNEQLKQQLEEQLKVCHSI